MEAEPRPPRVASRLVKLQRPSEGHRVQSLLKLNEDEVAGAHNQQSIVAGWRN